MTVGFQHGLVINDGKRLLLQVGDDIVNIMPPNLVARKCVKKVTRIINDYTFSELVSVEFKNGHKAELELHLDRPAMIRPGALKEFQATCIMVYDL